MTKKPEIMLFVRLAILLLTTLLITNFFYPDFIESYFLAIVLFFVMVMVSFVGYARLKWRFEKEHEINFKRIKEQNNRIKKNIKEITDKAEILKKESDLLIKQKNKKEN